MAARLGATFIETAMGPLTNAGTMLSASRVADGLAMLTEARLMQAVRAGIVESAKKASARPQRVEKLLPWDDLRASLERVTAAQQAAADAWKQHAGGLGGLLSGVGDVTAEGETPDPGWYLSKLAGKLIRDKRLSHPLDLFAGAVTEWQQLVGRCGAIIDASSALRFSYRFKRIRLIVLGVALFAAVAWLVSSEMSRRATQRRIAEGLAGPDPCTADKLAPADMAHASDEQRALQKSRIEACAVGREQARLAASCEAVAAHAETGKLAPEDEAFVGAKAPLLGRIAAGALEAADLRLGEAAVDIGCPAIAPRIWALVGKAAASSAGAWTAAEEVSEPITKLLTRPGAGLTPEARQALADRAEPVAKRAVFQGAPADIARGKTLCELQQALHLDQGKWCTALGVALSRQKR